VTYLFGSSETSTLITGHEPMRLPVQKEQKFLGDIDLSTTDIARGGV
jgi:hypothetical protein